MKTSDRHRHALRAKTARDRHRARELIGLHAGQTYEAVMSGLFDARDDALDGKLDVHLVKGVDFDRDVLAQDLPFRAVSCDRIEASH